MPKRPATTPDTHLARARAKALKLLATSDRSRAELLSRLARSCIPPAIAGQVADELTRAGLLDDARLAARLAERELRSAPAGKILLEHRIRRAGLSEDLALAASAHALTGHDPIADALALGCKLLTSDPKAHGDPAGARRRLAAKLARRGFDEESVATILDRLCPESGQT